MHIPDTWNNLVSGSGSNTAEGSPCRQILAQQINNK